MFDRLEGKTLACNCFGYRESRIGADEICSFYLARADIVNLLEDEQVAQLDNEQSGRQSKQMTLCITLAASRFLRRMVRIIVVSFSSLILAT